MQPILFRLGILTNPGLQRTGTTRAPKGVGPSMRMRAPVVMPTLRISGVTRDNTGAILGSCEVELYRRNQDQTRGEFVDRTVSDGSGNFSFTVGQGQLYQFIAYKVGSPDVAGVSLRTEVGL